MVKLHIREIEKMIFFIGDLAVIRNSMINIFLCVMHLLRVKFDKCYDYLAVSMLAEYLRRLRRH